MKRLHFIYGFFFVVQFSYAQLDIPKLTALTPPSPNAASLGKYGETPVNLSTGVPSISIPLYEVKEGKISVPISLNYHSQGIRVEERASWVGLGWSLSSGGVITRVMRGMPDEFPNGFRTMGDKVLQFYTSMTSQERENYMVNVEYGSIDAEPDIYYYNFGGYSGKFFFTNDGQIFSMPRNNLKFEYLPSSNTWQIITPDGNKYLFSETETTISTPYTRSNGGPESDGNPIESISSWFLKEIQDIYDNKVQFTYTASVFSFRTKAVEVKKILAQWTSGSGYSCGFESGSSSTALNDIYGKRLTKISFTGGEINFIPTQTFREDLTDYSLAAIRIQTSGTTVKEYKFSTSYFLGGGGSKRLRLDALTESTNDIQDSKHEFTYNQTSLPTELSNSQDHWGYFNGVENLEFVNYTYNNGVKKGANKEPNTFYAQAGILEKIKYPTGGSTMFEYAGNTVAVWKTQHYTDQTSILNLSGHNNNASNTEVYYQESFNITTSDVGGLSALPVRVSINQTIENPNNAPCYITFSIQMPGGGAPQYVVNDQILQLPVGSYTLYAHISSEYAGNPYAFFTINLIKQQVMPAGYYTEATGGLRIKKIVNYTGNNTISDEKEFEYNKFDQTYSSGSVGSILNYVHQETFHNIYQVGTVSFPYSCLYNSFSSGSKYPLVSTSGSHVIYSNVTTKYGNNYESGKTESTFSSYAEHPDGINTAFPFPSNTSVEWKRGLLLKQTQYRKNSTGFSKVTEEEYIYNFRDSTNDPLRKISRGIKVGRDEIFTYPASFWTGFRMSDYMTLTEFYHLSTKKKRTYKSDSPGDFLEETENFAYSDIHFQPITISKTSSNGESIIVNNKYPPDYISGLSNEFVSAKNELVTKNYITSVLESTLFVNLVEKQKVRTNFKLVQPFGETNYTVVPYSVEVKRSGNGALQTEIVYEKYLKNGNTVEQKDIKGVTESYIWGYQLTKPVAQIINATYSEVFHDNFEDLSGWDGSMTAYDKSKRRTGSYSGRIDKPGSGELVSHSTKWLTISLTAPKKFKYSTWVYSNGPSAEIFLFMKRANETGYFSYVTSVQTNVTNKWVLIEGEYNVPADVTQLGIRLDNNGGGSVWFDDVRLHPSDAMMTTYTYKPLVGMSSQTDVNNHSVYYEYDAFNRLNIVRDQDGKIIKNICYNYAGQAEECNVFYNAVKTGNFTKANCSGGTGSTVTYTVAEGVYSASSQTAADALAQNDVDANGQAYANQHGTCVYSSASYSGTYYSTACSGEAVPEPIYVNVPAGMFTSSVSLQDANSQALAYAQNYANTYGTCATNVNLYGQNDVGDDVYIILTNTSTYQQYFLYMSPFAWYGQIGTVPPGNYDVEMGPSGFGYINYSAGCSNFSSGYNAFFYNITINSSCNTFNFY